MKKQLALIFTLLCMTSALSGCAASDKNALLLNGSEAESGNQELFYGELRLPEDMFSIIAFYNNYIVYLTLDEGNNAGISRFDVGTGSSVEICRLDDYLMSPANNTILDGILYLNYMTTDTSRKMIAIDIDHATEKIIVAEDGISGLVYSAATSESVYSLKHTKEGLSVIECYMPENGTNDVFLEAGNNQTISAISVFDEQLYAILHDETGKYCIMQYDRNGNETAVWDISFADSILQDSQIGLFQVMDEAFYFMNFSGESAAFQPDGTPLNALDGWSIATNTAVSLSQYSFFCRGSDLAFAIYDTGKNTLNEFPADIQEPDTIRYVYADYNNPWRLLVSLRNEETGSERVSVINSRL